ncbi:hypothetical protein M1L60_08145 [Actinoplanes sp. TRM 88003]|uniref:Uncharacterized protein n=1 Tax=Paractinoplanes aksuensis TaxID=2939490 RepID=A0ABT1DIB5_9ACTN|nr:hypothetical protein [Actinoplanes aksuensis]MCO8270567.1 hypothetical protein [Actinoplanes aksuensis]
MLSRARPPGPGAGDVAARPGRPATARALRLVMRAGRPLPVVSLGALSGVVEAVFLVIAGLVWATRGRAGVLESARGIVAWEMRRLSLPPVSTDGPRMLGFTAFVALALRADRLADFSFAGSVRRPSSRWCSCWS